MKPAVRWWLALLGALFASHGARAATLPEAVVTVRMGPAAVEAEVRLDRPVTRFVFAAADVVRKGDFELLEPGLRLEGDTVTGPRPFSRFSLRIKKMTGERDAKYPAHFRIGAGGVLYAPALKADPAEWRTRLRFRTAADQIRLPAGGPVEEGFVYVGPANLASQVGGILVVSDPDTPQWLVERARSSLATAVGTFTKFLGAPLPRRPMLIIRHDDGPRNFNVGDVTPGAVTSLRFHGAAWKTEDETAARSIQSFLFHEAFHFWNGGLASPGIGTPTWLHEGGAEYAALLAGVSTGNVDEEEALKRLSTALQRCRFGLENAGDKGMAEIDFLSNEIRYPCGMVLHWAADLRVRRSRAGGRTILDAWADMIRIVRQRGTRTYALSDFYAAAGMNEGEDFGPAALLVKRSGPARWRALAQDLNALGADVIQLPTTEGRRGALLFHLLRQNCTSLPEGAAIGFYTDAGKVRLDSPRGCGVLTGNPPIKSVEGGDPFAPSAETYEAVQRKCAAGAEVTFVTEDGRSLAATCAKPLAPAPEDYVVRRWLPQDAGAGPEQSPDRTAR